MQHFPDYSSTVAHVSVVPDKAAASGLRGPRHAVYQTRRCATDLFYLLTAAGSGGYTAYQCLMRKQRERRNAIRTQTELG